MFMHYHRKKFLLYFLLVFYLRLNYIQLIVDIENVLNINANNYIPMGVILHVGNHSC